LFEKLYFSSKIDTMDEVLLVNGLAKSFGNIKAVDNICFNVERGETLGVLGPNGSGKTTTLSIVLGLKYPDAGTFSWFEGLQGPAANKRIGSLLEVPFFYPYLNLIDNLKIVAEVRGIRTSSIGNVLEQVRLENRAKSPYYTLSLGMKQRLALASALLGDPEVLVLDEPTNGLDPEGIAEVRELVRHHARMGKTIIMASHILDEVEKVCSHVVILKEGKIISQGRVSHLLSEKQMALLGADNMRQLAEVVSQVHGIHYEGLSGNHLVVSLDDGVSLTDVNIWLAQKGVVLNHLEIQKKTLESEFLKIVKEVKSEKVELQ
jgi:ABC-2 type transport system ATP-binding protein